MRQLDNGALAFFEVEARVGSFAGDTQLVVADAFSRRFDGTVQAMRRLEHQHASRFAGEFFSDGARGLAANFFIRYEKYRDRTRQLTFRPVRQRFDYMENESNPALHVEHPRSPCPAFTYSKWHFRNCANGINSVGMAEQKHRLAAARAGLPETNFQMIAEFLCTMDVYLAAKLAKA